MKLSTLACLSLALGLPLGLAGCDRETEHTERTVTTPDGRQTHQERSVTEHSDGGVTVHEEKKVAPATTDTHVERDVNRTIEKSDGTVIHEEQKKVD